MSARISSIEFYFTFPTVIIAIRKIQHQAHVDLSLDLNAVKFIINYYLIPFVLQIPSSVSNLDELTLFYESIFPESLLIHALSSVNSNGDLALPLSDRLALNSTFSLQMITSLLHVLEYITLEILEVSGIQTQKAQCRIRTSENDLKMAISLDSDLKQLYQRLNKKQPLIWNQPLNDDILIDNYPLNQRKTEEFNKKHVWFHNKNKIKKVLKSWLNHEVQSQDNRYFSLGIRPIVYYGQSIDPVFTDYFTPFHSNHDELETTDRVPTFHAAAFNLIDKAETEYQLAMEIRSDRSVRTVEGSIVNRVTGETLFEIQYNNESGNTINLQLANVDYFNHYHPCGFTPDQFQVSDSHLLDCKFKIVPKSTQNSNLIELDQYQLDELQNILRMASQLVYCNSPSLYRYFQPDSVIQMFNESALNQTDLVVFPKVIITLIVAYQPLDLPSPLSIDSQYVDKLDNIVEDGEDLENDQRVAPIQDIRIFLRSAGSRITTPSTSPNKLTFQLSLLVYGLIVAILWLVHNKYLQF